MYKKIEIDFWKDEPSDFIDWLLYFDALITNMIMKIVDKIIFKVSNI